MKIRPVILCGGEGTRLWPKSKNNQAKQFINFGGWNLLEKTFDRVKNKIFDYPIISTNIKYLNHVKTFLKKKYRLKTVKSNLKSREIYYASQLKEGDIIDIFYFGQSIKENCLVIDLVQDHYFTSGLVTYLNGTSRETIDLENQDGLWIKKVLN